MSTSLFDLSELEKLSFWNNLSRSQQEMMKNCAGIRIQTNCDKPKVFAPLFQFKGYRP